MNDDADDGVMRPRFYVAAVKDAAASTLSSEPASRSSAQTSRPLDRNAMALLGGWTLPELDRMDAMALLGGWTDPDDQDRQHFFKSSDEVEARYALVRLLLDYSRPLSPNIREWLAALFMPSENRIEGRMADRRIDFKFRRKGKPSNQVRNTAIASYIWDKTVEFGTTTKAIDGTDSRSIRETISASPSRRKSSTRPSDATAATDKFNISSKEAREIWAQYKLVLAMIHAVPLTGPSATSPKTCADRSLALKVLTQIAKKGGQQAASASMVIAQYYTSS
jgi:hypothetical protein